MTEEWTDPGPNVRQKKRNLTKGQKTKFFSCDMKHTNSKKPRDKYS